MTITVDDIARPLRRTSLGDLVRRFSPFARREAADPAAPPPEPPLSEGKIAFLTVWAGVVSGVYICIGIAAFWTIFGERFSAGQSHIARMTPGAVERGQTPPDPIPETGDFVPVTMGLYLDGIETLSIRDSFWTATFYVWFRWNGDRSLAPGTNFRIVDGRIERRDLQDEYYGPDGTNYQRFRVVARLTKFFNTTRVPRDDHMLNIYIEDARFDAARLRYVADPATNVSSRVRVAGYTVTGGQQAVKTHTYRTSYGDPRLAGSPNRTFSQYVYGLTIERAGIGIYFKIFIGLFAGMALAFASFGLRASDAGPRFSMLAGAYFGAVANSYLAGSLIPFSGQFGLVEYVTFTGLFTIFFALIATIVSIYIWNVKADKQLSRAFDLVTIATAGVGYVIVNLVMPLSAA